MNYLEELQKINEDYQKCKNVVRSCVWDTQLTYAGVYCNNFVTYHVNRLGFVKRYRHDIFWTVKDWFAGEYKIRKRIIEYLDLCVDELKYLVETQEVNQYYEDKQIGYGDHKFQDILRIQQEVKKWEDKKIKENLNEHRTIARDKLQID